jgi:hypothetical protein
MSNTDPVPRRDRPRSPGSVTFVVAGALALALALTGCGPQEIGTGGISVDAAGRPVLVLAVCQDSVRTVGITDLGPAGKDYRSTGHWDSPVRLRRGLMQLPLAAMPSPWTERVPFQPLVPGEHYTAGGGGSDNTTSTSAVDFTAADLRDLAPGTVFYQEQAEQEDSSYRAVNRVVPLSTFFDAACR